MPNLQQAAQAVHVTVEEVEAWLLCSYQSEQRREYATPEQVRRRAQVIWWRYCAPERVSYGEIGRRLGVSGGRVQQIERNALGRLRYALHLTPALEQQLAAERHALRVALMGPMPAGTPEGRKVPDDA